MSGRRLYIGRVPHHATNRDFQDHFGSIGKLVETRIMAGFAFIEYDQLRDAEQAVQELNNKDFLNERILVEFAKPPRQMMDDRYGPPRGYGGGPPRGYGGGGYGGGPGGYDNYGPPRNPPARPGNGYRLTISGLGQGTSWQDLKDFGRTIGSVSFADVDRNDPTVGFIEFSSRRDADDALEKLDNRDLHGSVVRVTEERGSSRRDDGYSSRRDDDRRGDDRRGDDGYRSSGRDRDRYDDRERSSRRRSPTPEKRRSRSPERRRSRSPAAPAERERSPMRERSRSPARERRDDY